MKSTDPKITVAEALESVGGNQAELARLLGVTRASVSKWVTSHREYMPLVAAYRYAALRGHAQDAA